MGGKNHQPCRKYIRESIMLSKATSDILAKLEIANSLLEDVLLAELNGENKSRYMKDILKYLIESKNKTEEALKYINCILVKMDKLKFQDSEMLNEILALKDAFIELEIIPRREFSAWEITASILEKEGFKGIFIYFHKLLEKIKENLQELIELFVKGQEYTEKGNLLEAIETNELPIRQSFVKVYLAYLDFSAIFTCSSIISTEVYLRTNGYPSLLSDLNFPRKRDAVILSEV